MKRVEVDCDDLNRMAKIIEAIDNEDIQYIFMGWPLLQGEVASSIEAF
jgi:hypothetical protein